MHSTQAPLHVIRAEFSDSRLRSARRHNLHVLAREARRGAWRRCQELVCRGLIGVLVAALVVGVVVAGLDLLRVVMA